MLESPVLSCSRSSPGIPAATACHLGGQWWAGSCPGDCPRSTVLGELPRCPLHPPLLGLPVGRVEGASCSPHNHSQVPSSPHIYHSTLYTPLRRPHLPPATNLKESGYDLLVMGSHGHHILKQPEERPWVTWRWLAVVENAVELKEESPSSV